MPLTKTKKIHRELRKNRTDVVFYGVKFSRNTFGKEACLRYLFIYLFIFNGLKFMYLCFICIFRYSYYHEAGPISDTSKK